MTIDNLEIQISSSSQQASNGIMKLSSSLTTLKQVAKGGAGLSSVANSLKRLNEALATMKNPAEKLSDLVTSLNTLSSIDKATGLKSTITQLKKLPEVAEALDKADMGKFARTIEQVTKAIKPLANEMEKVSMGFSALPTKIQRVIQSNARLTASNRKNGSSYGILGTGIKSWQARLGIATAVTNALGNTIGGWIEKSNAYVENLNLFTVSLGEYAEEAQEYAETVGELMGIDPSDWLRAQGIFNTLATGFGVASDKASTMSKNLTQLSYDISSLYNINVSDAMTKLQSAFSGELEPVRRLGYDLSQTKLQAIAYANGIDMLVSEMTQAEKSMLRYYALMTQVTVVQGDMARTLNAPANQLRIFSAQLEQAKRALGNIFIPALNAVLPYLTAFLIVLRKVANEIAMFLGFELPEIDYSDVNNLGSGIDDNFDDATASAKKLKNQVAGFDELNILNQDAGAGIGDNLGGLRFDLDVPEYDFLKGLTESKANKIAEKLEEPFRNILSLVSKIGAGILAWKIGEGVIGFANTLKGLNMSELNNLRVPVGLTLSVTGLAFAFEGAKAIGYGDATLGDYIKTAVGSALGLAGALIAFGTGPLGWTIGITAVVAVNIIGFATGYDQRLEDVVNEAFYGYTEGAIDVDVLTDYFSDLIKEVPKVNEPIKSAGEEIKKLGEKTQTTADSIKDISSALSLGIETAEINVPLLTEQIGLLATDSKRYSDETYDNIIRAVSTSLRESLVDAGYNVPLIIDQLERLKTDSSIQIEAIEEKMKLLSDSYDMGNIASDEFESQMNDLVDQMILASGQLTKVDEDFKSVALTFEKGINFESPVEVRTALSEISETAKTAKEEIETTFALLRLEVKNNSEIGDELKSILLNSIDISEGKQLDEVKSKTESYANIIQTELIKAMEREYNALKTDYEELNPVNKIFAGYGSREGAGHTEKGLNKYIDETAGEIVGEIQKMYDQVGIDSKPFATDTMNKIVDNLFDYEQSRGHGSITVFSGEITSEINKALQGVPALTVTEATNVGKSINTGIEKGINENSMLVRTATEGLSDLMITSTMGKLGIHSPSTVYADFGLYIDEGLANGITDNSNLVSTAMDDMLNTMLGRFEEFTNRIRTALNSMLSDFARSMASMSVDEEGDVSYSKIQPKSIPRFATGGFPENGLFFANSSEIVGKFSNGRTAVANNQQITDGIATAVYNAIVSANQEQGNRDVNVYLDGKQINTSVEKAKREKGTSIMTGGLIYG